MATELEKSLESLKRCINSSHPTEAQDIINNILKYFESSLTSAELDLAIENIFNERNGSLVYLNKTLKCNKLFKSSNLNMFALYQHLINLHSEKIKPYSDRMIETLMKYITSNVVTAKEKELCILILQDIVKYKLCITNVIDDIIEDLFTIFNRNIKEPPARFVQFSMELLGLISRDYPACFSEDYVYKFREILFYNLESMLILKKKISFLLLSGAFQALDYFLINFAPCDEPIINQRLYNYIKQISDPEDGRERAAFKCSLNLLAHHSSLMTTEIYNDHMYWHKLLIKWMTWSYDDRRVAIYTIQSVYSAIAEVIEKENNPNDKEILKFYIKYFRTILLTSTSKSYEVRYAIRGIGLMAGACQKILAEYIEDLLTLVIQRTEYACMMTENSTTNRDVLEHLPDFVQALSQIMNKTNDLSGLQIISLQNIIDILIRDFHYLSTIHHELVITSLLQTFYHLSRMDGKIFDNTLDKVITKGVIWTCSHKLEVEVDWNTFTDWKDNITFKNFLPLWEGLLKPAQYSDFDRTFVSSKIYDKLIKVLFKLIKKLNLKTKKRTFKDESGKDQELYFCDPNIDLSPIKPKDFHIFFNLVDLYKSLFKNNDLHVKYNFEKWISIYMETMIEKSLENPLISGFLKFISIGLKISTKIKYFKSDMSIERQHLFDTITFFLKKIISHIQKTSGELQISSIILTFSAPIKIILTLENIDDIFITAFNIGTTMLWLANHALNVLRNLVNYFKFEEKSKSRLLKNVLPCLDTFLLSNNFIEKSPVNTTIIKYHGSKKVKRNLEKMVDGEGELLKLQKKIILFLGELEPHHCLNLLSTAEETTDLVKWDVNQKLRLRLQTELSNSIIYLDTIMPRIRTLALTSSNRKLKIASCELIHTCVLYLLGTNNYNGEIWIKIIETIFYLGCDSDLAVQQMFEPLLMQIMHFLSQPNEFAGDGSNGILNCIMKLISHPTNCAVRDLSARCLREYIDWGIRQTKPADLNQLPVRIRSFIDHLTLFSYDANVNCKLGACLAFNNVYRILREQDSIINMFWLELFYVFKTNFLLSEEHSDDLEQNRLVIDHLIRVICERGDILMKCNSDRVQTKVYTEQNLYGVCIWLFTQCGAKHMNYRRKCMESCIKILSLPNFKDSRKEFTHINFKFNILYDLFEKEITIHPNLNYAKEIYSLSPFITIRNWLESLLASLDFYTWIIAEELIENTDLLLKKSVILEVVQYYLDTLLWIPVHEIFSKFTPDDRCIKINIEEKTKIELIKSQILILIINLLIQILKIYPSKSINMISLFKKNSKILDLLMDLIYHQEKLDIDLKNYEIRKRLPDVIVDIISLIHNKCNETFVSTFKKSVSELLVKYLTEIKESNLEKIHSENIRKNELNIANGIRFTLKNCDIFQLNNKEFEDLLFNLQEDLFNGLIEVRLEQKYPFYPHPFVCRYINKIMEISLSIKYTESILKQILKNEPLKKAEINESIGFIRAGDHFIDIYREIIFSHFLKHASKFIDNLLSNLNNQNCIHIIEILTDFCEFIYTQKVQDNAAIEIYSNKLLLVWEKIFELYNQNKFSHMYLIEFMSNLAMITGHSLENLGNHAKGFKEWILKMLKDSDLSLDIKTRIIFLIPCITGANDYENDDLMSALITLQSKHFPLRSSEFVLESIERSSYVSAFRALLDAIAVSKSPLLLKFLINATAADSKHIIEFQINESLKNFMRNKKINQQIICIDIALKLFCNENLESSLRMNILERFIITMIRSSYTNTIIEFYTLKITEIKNLINTPLGKIVDYEKNLLTRIGGYKLIELLFGLIKKEALISPQSSISKSFFNDDSKIKSGMELTRDLMKQAFLTRNEKFYSDDNNILEIYRKYQCIIYNCLLTIISNTQDNIMFYTSLLFKERPEKNEFVWKHLINIKNETLYEFQQDFDRYPKIKNRIISIQGYSYNESVNRKTSRYIQTASVFESSLSQEITVLDLTNSMVRTSEQVENMSTETLEEQRYYSLEKMPINDHEVMANLCAVINHMFDREITTITDENIKRRIVPEWIRSIITTLTDQNSHKNIRLFLAKVIDNCRNVFKKCAPFLLGPILQIIVDECTGNTLNSFSIDLIAMLLSWNEIYVPSTLDETYLATNLLKFLMKNAFNEKRDIFKLNLELIKNVVELWKSALSIPMQYLLDSINITEESNHRIACGIHLNAIVLANGLVPWTDITKQNFIRAIFNCIGNEYTAVYQPASQLMGMCLQNLSKNGIIQENDEIIFSDIIQYILQAQKSNSKKTMDILYGIQKHYPNILDTFLQLICNNIPNSIGVQKRCYLEMLLSRVEYLNENIYREIISLGILELLKQREYCLLSLHILNKVMSKFKIEEINYVIESIIFFLKSKDRNCREVAYEIIIFIVDSFTNDQTTEGKHLVKKCISNLLVGFSDNDPQIQARIYQYWSNDSKLPTKLSERFTDLLTELYDPGTEENFLCYSSYLLLQPVINHPNSKQQIFEFRSEHDYKLTEYSINTNWRSQNTSTMSPLFVESQQKALLSGDGSQAAKYLKATQNNLIFEPTLDPTIMQTQINNFTVSTQSSLLFDVQPQILDRRSQKALIEQREKHNSFEEKFRKRFIRDKEQKSKEQALRAVDRINYNKSKLHYEMKRAEKQITLYRRYRIGEYPDLLITTLALLLPLQGLAKLDPLVARHVFVSIFTSTDFEVNNLILHAVSSSINNILNATKQCDPVLFGALMEMTFIFPEHLKFAPELISVTASASNMLASGILHIENEIVNFLEDDVSSKSSTSSITHETKFWIKLSDLYFGLSESDIVESIYSDKLKSHPSLAKGIQYENEGNFSKAQQEYLTIMNSVQNNPVEQDFCYQSFYNCFMHMGNWTDLSKYISKQVTTMDEFWTEWNKENFLPHYIRSELRLILDGDNFNPEFLKVLDTWVRNPEHLEYLTVNFGEEMMMLQVANHEYRQAQLFAEKALSFFLSEWVQLSSLSQKLRLSKLLNMRKIAEIHNYIGEFLTNKTQLENRWHFQTLINRWNSTVPKQSDSVLLWDTILSYRLKVSQLIENESLCILNDVISDMKLTIPTMYFKLLEVASDQSYINLYEKIVTRLQSQIKGDVNDWKLLEWYLSRSKIYILKSKFKPAPQALKLLNKSWEKIHSLVLSSDIIDSNLNVKIKALNVLSDISIQILKLMPSIDDRDDLHRVSQLIGMENCVNLSQQLFTYSLNSLKNGVDVAKILENDYRSPDVDGTSIIANAYFKYAQFCYEFQNSEWVIDPIDMIKKLMFGVLNSMKYDSYNARHLFPSILQIEQIKTDQSLQENFNIEIENIPDWMFLEWIPQILSHFDFKNPCYLDKLILRLCKSYPNAMIYPFQLSYNQYYAKNPEENRNVVNQIKNHLKNPIFDLFLKNISNLCLISVQFKFHLQKLLEFFLKSQNQPNITNEDWKNEINYIVVTISERDIAKDNLFPQILQLELKLKEISKLDFRKEKIQIETEIRAIINALDKLKYKNAIMDLRKLSIWMANFKSFNINSDDHYLEVPGQYIGNKKPDIQNHVKITSFDQTLEIFSSLRQPVKLKIYGNNGRTYNFLVKYGEDLRQDQRIQKLFELMSSEMQLDKSCLNHNLRIITYNVIPLNCYCGMTSWVENTNTLRNFIFKSMNRRLGENTSERQLKSAMEKYTKFICTSLNDSLKDSYGKAVIRYTKDKLKINFNEIINSLPIDMLKFALFEISNSPESFYVLRNNFATSISASNIAQWVLGIGDRNLSNIMINITTGYAVGIDFGLSFGAGIRDQFVPELIPFRLTPQIVNTMLPMGVSGFISKSMIHTLRRLKLSKKLLLSCMDVFIREPTIDWLDVVARQSDDPITESGVSWIASERIEIVSKKLSGYNPCYLNKIQLEKGILMKNPQYLTKYIDILTGIPQFNIRAQLPESDLSVEQQVAALIDLATDPVVLGICYVGFMPFI